MDARVADHRRGGALTSLIFPTYNPGLLVQRTCEALRTFLRQATGRWEVLFVCDGCTDGTPQRLTELLRDPPAVIRILAYPHNRGKGYAVREGLAAARGDWRIFADVDLAYGFDDIGRLARLLQSGADVAIASRSHRDSRIVLPTALQGYLYRRHLQSLAFSLLTRWLLPLSQRDTQAGLKGLSARAARLVLPELTCDGFGFDCEMLTACVHHGLSITEMPVCVYYADPSSTTNPRAVARMLADIWRIRTTWRKRSTSKPAVSEELPGRQAA